MNRPDMEQIKEEIEIFERPTACNSKEMYAYILELEAKMDKYKTLRNQVVWAVTHYGVVDTEGIIEVVVL